MFTIEVTFTLAQANNDIVDDFPKLTVTRGRCPAIVLLLSSTWEGVDLTARNASLATHY
jgi:hypothetical protein